MNIFLQIDISLFIQRQKIHTKKIPLATQTITVQCTRQCQAQVLKALYVRIVIKNYFY